MIIYEKGNVIIRDSVHWDIDNFKSMREADKAEIWAEGHFDPKFALTSSIQNSSVSLTFLHNGAIVGMFGVSPDSMLATRAKVWMLTSEEIYNVKICFLKCSRWIIDKFLSLYPTLWNFVDARHEESIRWLRWVGAKIFDSVPYGIEKIPFHYFNLEKS